jgi:hypothetical protein
MLNIWYEWMQFTLSSSRLEQGESRVSKNRDSGKPSAQSKPRRSQNRFQSNDANPKLPEWLQLPVLHSHDNKRSKVLKLTAAIELTCYKNREHNE